MRIAVSGVHGIGKTTLLEQLASDFQLDIIEEKARVLMKTKYVFSRLEEDIDLFKSFEKEIMKLQSVEEMTLRDGFIVDRPHIDSFVYVKERFISSRHDDLDYFREYKEQTYALMKNRYDLIFFIRPTSAFIKQDGIRNVNPFFVMAIDEFLEKEYAENDWGCEVVQIESDVFNTRLHQASNKIKDYIARGKKAALEKKQYQRTPRMSFWAKD